MFLAATMEARDVRRIFEKKLAERAEFLRTCHCVPIGIHTGPAVAGKLRGGGAPAGKR
jgi:class 3 adenylate cyclase